MIDEYEIKRLIYMEALKAEIEAMKVSNSERDLPSEAVAYTYEDFCEKAEELRTLANQHKHQL